MHEILAAYTAKGDGDREMLFALLNAKAAEDNVSSGAHVSVDTPTHASPSAWLQTGTYAGAS
jgi:hypothetical protein